MIPSRYMLIGEKSPYPVKRRVRGRRDGNYEPAITLLPPDPYLIMEKPNFDRLPSPTMYRAAPPKSAKNKEASSFVILGDTVRTPVHSRPGSPSGRVSPFRGHGFKSPNTTRPNSRVNSPTTSPGRTLPKPKPDKPRISKDIGLPPKSPKSKKPKPLTIAKAETKETSETETKPETQQVDVIKTEEPTEAEKEGEVVDTQKEVKDEDVKPEPSKEELKPEAKSKPKLAAGQNKKPPVSPVPKNKPKGETMEEKSAIRKVVKPPIPPKKVGMKATLKSDVGKQTEQAKAKEASQVVKSLNAESKEKEKEEKGEKKKEIKEEKKKESMEGGKDKKKEVKEEKKKEVTEGGKDKKKEVKKDEGKEEKKEMKKEEVKEGDKMKVEDVNGKEMKKEEVTEEKKTEVKKGDEKEGKKEEKKEEKKDEKLVPCFQPDKCQIAPPTMASPSPIITPSFSTPSTSADLASNSTKNSQSISTAPTTVTPSTFSSVSSTVVLSGNLARKEIEHRTRTTGAKLEPLAPAAQPPPNTAAQMVKASSRDSISWTKKDNLSGEITSTTKVIKADPEMEVLSPNNLRDSPPRAPPPNLAWEDDRLPNGDVPNKAETQGKFRRFISVAWKFLSYLIYCRCLRRFKCCRRQQGLGVAGGAGGGGGAAKPSIFSKLNCFKCPNPFKRCFDCCRSKCGERCQCCREKSKPKSKPRKCCAKSKCCSFTGCCDRARDRCWNCRDKVNNCCRSLFCLNLMCCQKFLRKFKFCHKLKCCQKDGFCSCCNPNVKRDVKKLNKKGSRGSNNSRDKDNLDQVLVEHTSVMKAAIPVLPSCLAVFCLICNLFVPGFGTFISGMLCLCFGKPRFSAKDTPKNRFGSFVVNTIIAVAQLFTVVFCLVGWGWSIWWGVIMYKLSRRQKRLKLAEKNQKEAEGSNVNHNHVDVEQG